MKSPFLKVEDEFVRNAKFSGLITNFSKEKCLNKTTLLFVIKSLLYIGNFRNLKTTLIFVIDTAEEEVCKHRNRARHC